MDRMDNQVLPVQLARLAMWGRVAVPGSKGLLGPPAPLATPEHLGPLELKDLAGLQDPPVQ